MLSILKNMDLPPHIQIRILNCKKKFKTIGDILTTSPEDIQRISKLSMTDVHVLLLNISRVYTNSLLLDRHISYSQFKDKVYSLPTRFLNFDEASKGGLMSKGIIELSGQSGVGKTQFCLHLCSHLLLSILQHESIKTQCILYISTENSFPVQRFEQIIQAITPLSQNNIVDKIKIMDLLYLDHIGDMKSLWDCLRVKLNQLFNMQKRVSLLVIDSVASLFRGEPLQNDIQAGDKTYTAKGIQSFKPRSVSSRFSNTRTDSIKELAAYLHHLNQEHDMAILCVNQMSDVIDYDPNSALMQHYAGMGYFDLNDNLSTPKVPCLGMAWSQYVTTRLHVTKPKACVYDACQSTTITNLRKIQVLSAPNSPRVSTDFRITASGLVEE